MLLPVSHTYERHMAKYLLQLRNVHSPPARTPPAWFVGGRRLVHLSVKETSELTDPLYVVSQSHAPACRRHSKPHTPRPEPPQFVEGRLPPQRHRPFEWRAVSSMYPERSSVKPQNASTVVSPSEETLDEVLHPAPDPWKLTKSQSHPVDATPFRSFSCSINFTSFQFIRGATR